MSDSSQGRIIVGGRLDITFDPKAYLIARLANEFKEAHLLSKEARKTDKTLPEFPDVQVSSGWPVAETQLPAIAVLSNGRQLREQYVGESLGDDQEVSPLDSEPPVQDVRGGSYHQAIDIWVFSLRSPERDLLSRITGFMLRVITRDLAAIEGIEHVELSGDSDHQDNLRQSVPLYMTEWNLSLVVPNIDIPAPGSEEEGQYRVSHVDVVGDFREALSSDE